MIHELEEQLPVALFKHEWWVCGHNRKKKDKPVEDMYVPLTDLERWIPIAFGVLYLVLIGYALLAPVDKKETQLQKAQPQTQQQQSAPKTQPQGDVVASCLQRVSSISREDTMRSNLVLLVSVVAALFSTAANAQCNYSVVGTWKLVSVTSTSDKGEVNKVALGQNPARGADYPAAQPGNFVVKDFQFKSGERLSEVKLHYYTLGKPQKDASGKVRNAVLILHGTGGSGDQFLTPTFGGVLFGPGQLLDAGRYFIILPDNVGHGESSKPSDGAHKRFPHYEYDDMIELQYRLLTQGLGVDHLRLVMGTSMGGMHTWLWAEQHPDFIDAAMPLASQPTEIAGRNRMMRRLIMDAIRTSPDWNNGEYQQQPHGLNEAVGINLFMSSSPLQLQKQAPTRDKADEFLENFIATRVKTTDANNMPYYADASRNYNPEPNLEKIVAPLTAINSADDQINPPELGIIDKDIHRVKNGKFVLLPITDATRGHRTHSLPAIWGNYMKELLDRSGN